MYLPCWCLIPCGENVKYDVSGMKALFKIFWSILLCIACLIGAGLYAFDRLFSGLCGNEVFAENAYLSMAG
jgi:hypothetical protein